MKLIISHQGTKYRWNYTFKMNWWNKHMNGGPDQSQSIKTEEKLDRRKAKLSWAKRYAAV